MAAPGDSAFALFSSVRYDAGLRAAAGSTDLAHAGWNFEHASPYYMLDFHRDRLLRAATHWGWAAAVAAVAGDSGLERLAAVLDRAVQARAAAGAGDGPFRCRIVLGEDGNLGCEANAATPASLAGLCPPQLPPPGFMTAEGGRGEDDASPLLRQLRTAMGRAPYEVTLDADTTAASAHTHYKTTRRQMYDAARRRAGITGPELREVLLVNASRGVIMDGSISTVYLWRGGRWVTPPVPATYGEEPSGSGGGSGGLDGTTRRWALKRHLAVEEEVRADSLRDGEECWLSNGVRGFLFGTIKLE